MSKTKVFCFGFGQVAESFINKLINEKKNFDLSVTSRQETHQVEFNNIKIIINDFSILLEEYVKMIKSNQNHFFVFKINFFLVKTVFVLNKLLLDFKLTRKTIISKNRLKYIQLNPSTEIIDKNKKFSVEETINDTKLFFK